MPIDSSLRLFKSQTAEAEAVRLDHSPHIDQAIKNKDVKFVEGLSLLIKDSV
jgi:hypothetical protein